MLANFEIEQTVIRIAQYLMVAAQTAPKSCGMDTLEIKLLPTSEKENLANRMEQIGLRDNRAFFSRDAGNVRQSDAVILIGSYREVRGLNCSMCDYLTCAHKPDTMPCVFNAVDLGIAIGSLVSSAMDFKVDNRIMYSIGRAALELNLFTVNISLAFGIPLSVGCKNIFFDRSTVL